MRAWAQATASPVSLARAACERTLLRRPKRVTAADPYLEPGVA